MGTVFCSASRSMSMASIYELRQKKNLIFFFLLRMFDYPLQDFQGFTLSASALQTERSTTHSLRLTAFLPSAASMQIRALELFFVSSLQLLLLATVCKKKNKDGTQRESVLMEELGTGVRKETFKMIQWTVPQRCTINKQLIWKWRK